MKYTVVERYADNGEFSHYDLINTENGETAITDIDQALQLQQTGVSGSNFTLEQILSKIKEVGLTNNDTSRFGDGYEKAINDVLLKFQNKCKKCGKKIEQQFRYCSIECKEYYYR